MRKKEISTIKAWERIYIEPQNFDYTELTCIGNNWNYKVFRYCTNRWEELKIKIKNSDYIEVWEDGYRHINPSSKIIPYEKKK